MLYILLHLFPSLWSAFQEQQKDADITFALIDRDTIVMYYDVRQDDFTLDHLLPAANTTTL